MTLPAAAVSIRAPRARAGRHLNTGQSPSFVRVSIRAPRARAGRLGGIRPRHSPGLVSIRAPRARAGRPLTSGSFAYPAVFQSAPRARARGDGDPAKRQSHKTLLLRFREQVEFFLP